MPPRPAASRPCHTCQETGNLGLRFIKDGHTIVRCQTCDLQYVDRIPDPATLAALYSAEFFAVGRKFAGDAASPGLINARHRVEAIGRLPGIGLTRWIDIGCATGNFLACAADTAAAVQGVELSPVAAAQAHRRGLDVATGDFLDVDVPTDRFDLVSMWDYVEHVPDPAANLRKAIGLLKPGGYLALSTGDVDSRMARISGRFWHLMIPPQHLYFFSPGTITRLLAAAGFEAIEIHKPGKRVPLDFALWKLTSLAAPGLRRGVLRACVTLGLGRIALRINLGDIMTVHARKPRVAAIPRPRDP